MKLLTLIPKLAAALALLLFGPLVGALLAFILALLSLGAVPNFAPGPGFLILLYLAIGLAVSIPTSVFGAGVILFRSRRDNCQPA